VYEEMINVGKSFNSQSHTRPSKNAGMNKVAQLRLDTTISRANQQQQTAMLTDGMDIYVWSKLCRGNVCTCYKKSNMKPDMPVDNSSEEFFDSTGSSNRETSDSWTLKRTKSSPISTKDDYESKVKRLVQDSDAELSSKLDNQDHNEIGIDPDNGLLTLDDKGSLFGGDETQCGICFGSGFVDSWNLHNGLRIVLETTKVSSMKNFLIDSNDYPSSFKGPAVSNAYVEWDLELPTYFVKVSNVTIRNNISPTSNLKLIFSPNNGTNWYDATPENLTHLMGSKSNIKLRAIASVQDPTLSLVFTHVELFYILVDMPKAQMHNFSLPVNFEVFDALVQAQMDVGSEIPWIDREYVIGETKHGLLWKVTEATPKLSSARQIYGYELSLRMVQNYEQLYLLNLLNKKYVNLNYRGPETIQNVNLPIKGNYSVPFQQLDTGQQLDSGVVIGGSTVEDTK
jgi:hypothetical protein